jgi:hypothetical protein
VFEHASYLPFTAIIDIQDQEVRKELDAGRKGISEYRVAQIRERMVGLFREYSPASEAGALGRDLSMDPSSGVHSDG